MKIFDSCRVTRVADILRYFLPLMMFDVYAVDERTER